MISDRGYRIGATLLALLLLFAGAVAAADKHSSGRSHTNGAPLENYGVVWEKKLTRSGLPVDDTGWHWLRGEGVKSIVTFRDKDDVDYGKFGFASVLRIPMDGRHLPSEEQAEGFLKFIQQSSNQPVHIHCSAGKDRTGMMSALVRYAIDGWPMDKAMEEARQYRRGQPLMPSMVLWLTEWASKHKPGSNKLN